MNIQLTVLTRAVVLASALILALALPMQAQDSPSQQQLPTKQLEPSQDQLASFASAALQVQQIRSKWQTRMQEADSVEKTKEFQEKASTEMVSAVNESGLTVETYKAIAAAARDNPELADRIARLMVPAR
jgi:FKBP-type peptidyl-prolyl cis-trans isomerase